MTEEVKKNSQGLGIIALVAAILAFVMAIIPCVGVIAVVPGIIAIVLPLIGLPQANRDNSPRGMLVSGLVIGIIATFISLTQIMVVTKVAEHSGDWPNQIEDLINDIEDKITAEFGDTDFSIRVENGDETVVIDGTVNTNNDRVIEQLEKLEKLEHLEQLENLDVLDSLE
jgi:membrane-bound ClpP family serine protease